MARTKHNFYQRGEAIGTFIGTLVIAGLIVFFIVDLFPSDKITHFYRFCHDEKVLTPAQCKKWDIGHSSFIVNKNTQSVVDENFLISMEQPCIVVDNKNWTCNDGRFGFRKGVYFNNTPGIALIEEDLNWFQYYWLKINN